MSQFLLHHYPVLGGLIVGLVLIFWPPPKRPMEEKARQLRLAELRNGAAERYFEERRELEAYGPESAGPFRFWGVLILLLSLLGLLL